MNIKNKKELKEYVDSLSDDQKKYALNMVKTLEARVELGESLLDLLSQVSSKHEGFAESPIYNLISLIALTSTSNVDIAIMMSIKETNVLPSILKLLNELKDSSNDNDVLKDFKFSDN